MKYLKMIKQMLCIAVIGIYILTTVPLSYAQTLQLPAPGVMIGLSQATHPAILKGVKLDPDNAFLFDFIVDPGGLEGDDIKEESTQLIKYFLASLTIPEENLWVNLSPYEQDRVIPEQFGLTEMGRELLAQDYLLKQITASLMYPEDDTGRSFWNDIYSKAFQKYGTTDIPVDTFNKVWIVPDKAVVHEGDGVAYIMNSSLKVMLETDYVSMEHNALTTGGHVPEGTVSPSTLPSELGLNVKATQGNTASQSIAKKALREVILPILEKEVNEGEHFAKLRQIYHSLILATWYKEKMQNALLNQVYANSNKVSGVDHDDPEASQKIWEQYVQTFKQGVYDYIKEEYDPWTEEIIPRKYFSGGVDWAMGVEPEYVTADKRDFDNAQAVVEVRAQIVDPTKEARDQNEASVGKQVQSVVDSLKAQGINVAKENDRFLIREAVDQAGGLITLDGGGTLEVKDGVLIIIDKRFQGLDHAGRGSFQLAVYASDAQKAQHELTELDMWLNYAVEKENNIMTQKEVERLRAGDGSIESLGQRMRRLTNEGNSQERLDWQNKIKSFYHKAHIAGLRAERKYQEAQEYARRVKENPNKENQAVDEFDIFISSDGDIGLNDGINNRGGRGNIENPPIDPPAVGQVFSEKIYEMVESEFKVTIGQIEGIQYEGKLYIVWRAGKQEGKIYRVIDIPDSQIYFNQGEIYEKVDKHLKAIVNKENVYKNEEGLAIYLYDLYLGAQGVFGFDVLQYLNSDIKDFVEEVERKGVSRWLRERADYLGLDSKKTFSLSGHAYFLGPAFYDNQRYFNQENDEENISLSHATYSGALANIINLGGLVSVKRLAEEGIVKLTGEAGKGENYFGNSNRSISFYSGMDARDTTRVFGRNNSLNMPIIFGIKKSIVDQKSKNEQWISPGSDLRGEMIADDFVGLSEISYIFVPYFKVGELKSILLQNGYYHIKVYPMGYNGDDTVWDGIDLEPASIETEKAKNLGGIDFNPMNMGLVVQGANGTACSEIPNQDGCINFNFTPQQIEQMKKNILGLTPVIINIQPIINLPIFLGLNDTRDSTQLAHHS